MTTKTMPKRTVVLLALLVAVLVFAGASQVQSYLLKNELEAYAVAHAETDRDEAHEVAFTITVARTLGLFGEPVAKITTFRRPIGDTENTRLSAIDYTYVRRDGQWINTDSAGCTHEGCLAGVDEAFARASMLE